MKRALLLNADFTPIRFISEFDAITLLYLNKVVIVDMGDSRLSQWDEVIRSPSTAINIPATLRLVKRVNRKQRMPRFKRRIMFNRDDWRCQYCSMRLSDEHATIDHVMPTSRGGKTSWVNCVTACKKCNKQKAAQTPEEAGMRLLKKPIAPNPVHYWDSSRSSSWHPDWDTFLPRA